MRFWLEMNWLFCWKSMLYDFMRTSGTICGFWWENNNSDDDDDEIMMMMRFWLEMNWLLSKCSCRPPTCTKHCTSKHHHRHCLHHHQHHHHYRHHHQQQWHHCLPHHCCCYHHLYIHLAFTEGPPSVITNQIREKSQLFVTQNLHGFSQMTTFSSSQSLSPYVVQHRDQPNYWPDQGNKFILLSHNSPGMSHMSVQFILEITIRNNNNNNK